FFLLGADLVAAIQLLVYVGGTLVLVVFGVMLTAQGPFINMKTSGAEWAISALVGILLMGVLAMGILAAGKPSAPADSAVVAYAPKTRLVKSETAPYAKLRADYQTGKITTKEEFDLEWNALDRDQAANSSYTSVIGQGFLGVGVGPAHRETVDGKATVVRANYLLPFELVSVHLLVVLIGAAYLARAKRRRSVAS
ncbi:MAG TPA: NADH-quinone oxidoreductase subunit J, partial [Gemmataceae bacterium]|nr:NADH-quinone oxidoreductase subunit J [Gemmataceae bacterium]